VTLSGGLRWLRQWLTKQYPDNPYSLGRKGFIFPSPLIILTSRYNVFGLALVGAIGFHRMRVLVYTKQGSITFPGFAVTDLDNDPNAHHLSCPRLLMETEVTALVGNDMIIKAEVGNE
jgi:hypothetical protein